MAATDQESIRIDLKARAAELERVQALLVDAEQRAAVVPELQQRIEELEEALAETRKSVQDARLENQRLDARLMEGKQMLVDMMNSPSWQVTRPLRRAEHLLRAKHLLRDARP